MTLSSVGANPLTVQKSRIWLQKGRYTRVPPIRKRTKAKPSHTCMIHAYSPINALKLFRAKNGNIAKSREVNFSNIAQHHEHYEHHKHHEHHVYS